MAYDDDEQAKLKKNNTQAALEAAMAGRWREAASANQAIVDLFPADVEAWNRLGRAHMELGEYDQARNAYGKSRELDPYNSIADRNLKRLEVLAAAGVTKGAAGESQRVEPLVFIEEIGKAGLVTLLKLATKEVLARLDAGDKLNLRPAQGNLFIDSLTGEYLGTVDTRHALRLLKLMKGGNRYSATVISVAEDKLAVMIRETYQDPSQAGQMSFPPRLTPATRKPHLEDTGTEETEPGQETEEPELPVEESDDEFSDDDDDDEELEV
ncbi:tetratricopeptide repeat protein [Dehalogenimonas sp. THU2]|uniref:tetratricopeptide repeat protein n=1 Tax=Dehalogenimonas sp. THU2 TaxID=3151121 RepID=UPI0032182BD0